MSRESSKSGIIPIKRTAPSAGTDRRNTNTMDEQVPKKRMQLEEMDLNNDRLLDIKEIMDNHHQFIMRNISASDDLFTACKHYGVLSEQMIIDIKDSHSREDKIYKMLDLVAIKGPHTMNLFCDALQLSGHAFIADFLRDEMKEAELKHRIPPPMTVQNVEFCDGKDIIKYLCGKFERMLHEKEKQDLTLYLEKKFQSALQKKMYKKNYEDKEKALAAKQHQLEDNMQFNEMLKHKDELIIEMKTQLEEAMTESAAKGIQLEGMNKYMQKLSKMHQEKMADQLKYHNANDSSIRRLADRVKLQERICREMIMLIEPFMPPPAEDALFRRDSFANKSIDRLITEHDKCKWLLQKLLDKMAILLNIQAKYEVLCEDRDYVLLQTGAAKGTELKRGFQEFLVAKEGQLEKLSKDNGQLLEEIAAMRLRALEVEEKLSNVEEEYRMQAKSREERFVKDLVYKENEIDVLKTNRDQLLDTIASKDNRISELEELVDMLKKNLNLIEHTHQRSSSHRNMNAPSNITLPEPSQFRMTKQSSHILKPINHEGEVPSTNSDKRLQKLRSLEKQTSQERSVTTTPPRSSSEKMKIMQLQSGKYPYQKRQGSLKVKATKVTPDASDLPALNKSKRLERSHPTRPESRRLSHLANQNATALSKTAATESLMLVNYQPQAKLTNRTATVAHYK